MGWVAQAPIGVYRIRRLVGLDFAPSAEAFERLKLSVRLAPWSTLSGGDNQILVWWNTLYLGFRYGLAVDEVRLVWPAPPARATDCRVRLTCGGANPPYGCDRLEFDHLTYWRKALTGDIYEPSGLWLRVPPGSVVTTRLRFRLGPLTLPAAAGVRSASVRIVNVQYLVP
jgi:hypothetical protein